MEDNHKDNNEIPKGNISRTEIREEDGKNVFVKTVPVNDFDTRTLSFQTQLRQVISGKFNINRYESIGVKQINNELYYEVKFECIENPMVPLYDSDYWEVLAKSLAIIHNYCYKNSSKIDLPEKIHDFNIENNWSIEFNNDDSPELINSYKEALSTRRDIFSKLKEFNTNQTRFPVHRDLGPHNIMYDGTNYHLIDFDFASVDYFSIELMSVVKNFLGYKDFGAIENFLDTYFKYLDIPFENTFINDYLVYLCTNSFPFYYKSKIKTEGICDIADSRTHSLKNVYANKDLLEDLFEKYINKNKNNYESI